MSGKNLVRKYFDKDDTWTCPAGVKQVRVIALNQYVAQCSGGTMHGGFVTTEGYCYMMGLNSNGQLGNNTTTNASTRVFAQIPLFNGTFPRYVTQLACGYSHTVALDNTGDVWAWGRNSAGQLGDGTVAARSTPTAVSGIGPTSSPIYRFIGAGALRSGGIDVFGNAYMWGDNTNGGLGDNTTTHRSSPVAVAGGHFFRQLAIDRTVLGLDYDGNLWAWGGGAKGSLGNNTADVPMSTPVLVPGGKTWKYVSSCLETVIAIDSDGALWGWGRNSAGAVGDGTVVDRSTPTAVIGTGSAKFVECGGTSFTSYAIDTEGNAWAWGSGGNGQLGNDTSDESYATTPVLVHGSHTFAHISGYNSDFLGGFIGITFAGNVYTFGSNEFGQLGIGSAGFLDARSTPVVVQGTAHAQFLQGRAAREDFANEAIIDVTPGVVYDVSLVRRTKYVGYNNPIASGPIATKFILEYYL